MNSQSKIISMILSAALLSALFILIPSQKAYASGGTRLAGQDRYGTAVEISKAGFISSENVVLATGEDFPDALCSAPLAKLLKSPVLLTEKKSLSAETIAELKRLQAKNIFIIGGEGVISKGVENDLTNLGLNVERLSGMDRYDTSIKISEYIIKRFYSDYGVGNVYEAAVATGENFPDALSIAPVAASKGIPIILAPKDDLTDSLKNYTGFRYFKAYIIGGRGVISDQAAQWFPYRERIYGKDRYETNANILSMFQYDLDFSKAYAATGENFPDALSGSALAAVSNSPIILASSYGVGISGGTLLDKTVGTITALGGEGALPPDVLQKITANSSEGQGQVDNTPVNPSAHKDYVFYFNPDTDLPYTGAIFRMNKDGSQRTILGDTGHDGPYINVVGDYIYYRYSRYEIYEVRGESGSAYEERVRFPGKLYRMKIDGTEKTKISDDNAKDIRVIGDYIYYYNDVMDKTDPKREKGLYRTKTDGTGRARLCDISFDGHIINISGGLIFYYDGGNVYRMNLDGSGRTMLKDGSFMVYGTKDWIYYVAGDFETDCYIYKKKPDGTDMTTLYHGPIITSNIGIIKDHIYFTDLKKTTYRMNMDGSGLTKICGDVAYGYMVSDDYFYYEESIVTSGGERKGPTTRIKMDGTGKEELKY